MDLHDAFVTVLDIQSLSLCTSIAVYSVLEPLYFHSCVPDDD